MGRENDWVGLIGFVSFLGLGRTRIGLVRMMQVGLLSIFEKVS